MGGHFYQLAAHAAVEGMGPKSHMNGLVSDVHAQLMHGQRPSSDEGS